MTSDSSGWRRTATHSSASSLPGLSRMRLETPSLPMSCSRPARRSSAALGASKPMVAAMRLGDLGHARRNGWRCRATWRRRSRANASATRSSRASSACCTRSAGSSASTSGSSQRGPEGVVVARSRRARRPAPGRTTCRGARAPSRRRRPARRAARRPPSSGPGTIRAQQRDQLARQLARVAVAVPVLVELVDGGSAACSSRPIARAISAPRSQRICPSSRAPSTPMATSARDGGRAAAAARRGRWRGAGARATAPAAWGR